VVSSEVQEFGYSCRMDGESSSGVFSRTLYSRRCERGA
jgi:hypothetical protein